jgi:putative ABC transport system permease protein
MDVILRDFRYAARRLLRAPGFTIVAILTLALGIGANSAIFTLFDQVMLRALPVRDPGRLVILKFNGVDSGTLRSRMSGRYYFSEPMYRELAKRSAPVTGLLARAHSWAAVNWQNETEQVDSELVSGNYFDVLGVRPAAGRLIQSADDQQINGAPVLVLSYEFWQRRFGGRSDVVGQTLTVNAHPFTIVGVAAPGFRSVIVGEAPAIFVPISMEQQAVPGLNDLGEWRTRWLNLAGRLQDGVSREQAQAQLDPIWRALRQDDLQRMIATHKGVPRSQRQEFLSSPLILEPGTKGLSPLRGEIGDPLAILMIMVGLVLLIACANVATLLLARGAARQREIAVCFALGAPWYRVLRQLLAESLLLGLAGGLVGLLVAPWATTLLLRAIPEQAGLTGALSAEVDGRLLLFTFTAALVASVLAGIAPALRFSRPNIAATLKENSGSVAGFRSRMRSLLVGGQIGVSVVLLVAAGLFTRTLFNLRHVDVGFATEQLVSFEVNARLTGYQDTRDVYQRIVTALQRLPGTAAVAGNNVGLLNHDTNGDNVTIDSYKAP